MADKPILFSAPMVKALIDGRKTQTRRVLKPPYGTLELTGAGWRPIYTKAFAGDRLWVKENYQLPAILNSTAPRFVSDMSPVSYPATAGIIEDLDDETEKRIKIRPSIHMPRWASRITLTVTDVRVQRLQDCSEADAKAEGIIGAGLIWGLGVEPPDPARAASPVEAYARLWDIINGPEAWDANPWVVALTFAVHLCNIDKMEENHG
jgi:hypothetical protein